MEKMNRDQAIGQNLQTLRGDMTQQALADLMRQAGFKWSQATVWSVEKGERPLRLAEAEALVAALGEGLWRLTSSDIEAALGVEFAACGRLYGEIKELTKQFLEAQQNIRSVLSHAAEQGEALPEPIAIGGGWLTTSGPEEAVREAIEKWRSANPSADRVPTPRGATYLDWRTFKQVAGMEGESNG